MNPERGWWIVKTHWSDSQYVFLEFDGKEWLVQGRYENRLGTPLSEWPAHAVWHRAPDPALTGFGLSLMVFGILLWPVLHSPTYAEAGIKSRVGQVIYANLLMGLTFSWWLILVTATAIAWSIVT